MWFLIGIVISYSAMLWGYVWYLKHHIDDYQKVKVPVKPLNKWIQYGRQLSWGFMLFLVLAGFILPVMSVYLHKNAMHLPFWYEYLLGMLWIPIIICPVVIIALCFYGLRTLDREKESGFWDGIIRITLVSFFEIIIWLPVVLAYFRMK